MPHPLNEIIRVQTSPARRSMNPKATHHLVIIRSTNPHLLHFISFGGVGPWLRMAKGERPPTLRIASWGNLEASGEDGSM